MSQKRSADGYIDTHYTGKRFREDSLCENCTSLKTYIDDKFQELTEIIHGLHNEAMKKLDEAINENFTSVKNENLQRALNSSQQDFQDNITNNRSLSERHSDFALTNMLGMFPIETEEDLVGVEENISDDNEEAFVNAVKSIVGNDLKKTFKLILGKELMLDSNLDGTHGKLKFREFDKFYCVLKKAIVDDVDGPDADSCIRKAFQFAKRYHYTQTFLDRHKRKNNDPLRSRRSR